MAEARLAVAFQFSVTDEGIVVNFDKTALKFVLRVVARRIKRRFKDARNAIVKRSYPATPASWLVIVAALMAARFSEHKPTLGILTGVERNLPGAKNFDPVTVIIIVTLIAATVLWMIMGNILQLVLRGLLMYRGALFEEKGKVSLKTKIWFMMVKILRGRHPNMYSYQKSLPRMPVPSLDVTIKQYLESVKPFLEGEKFERMKGLAKDFQNGIGKKLQPYLVLKSWWSTNYVSDWWEQMIYLRARSPLMINSNFYGVDCSLKLTDKQCARAANMVYSLICFRRLIDKEKLEVPFAHGILPICAAQYERTFNTTRIPRKEQDHIHHIPTSDYVVVLHNGRYFKLQCTKWDKPIKPADLQTQIRSILTDASEPCEGESMLAALTAAERNVWAEAREKYFSSGVNKESLDVIENAAFVMCLDPEEMDYDKENPEKLNSLARSSLHGDGTNRWFDKSFNLIVYRNGKVGVNTEHSWADAPIMAHMFEWVLAEDIETGYTVSGDCKGAPEYDSLPPPSRLKWDIPEKCMEVIQTSREQALILINDLELHIMPHDTFGKGEIKKCRVSPDAFLQIAIQLSYFKNAGKFCLTYESATTRLFRDGRTETVRPCTSSSCAFARAMVDPSVPKEEKKRLFTEAAECHVTGFKKAMTGQGIDRHLFCLYIVSKYLGIESPFLQEVLSEPWRLSTSQTPTQQSKRFDMNKQPDLISAGGGFGPVADDGYGISYIIAGEDIVFFHITCKKSCPTTSAKGLAKLIKESMSEILSLFKN